MENSREGEKMNLEVARVQEKAKYRGLLPNNIINRNEPEVLDVMLKGYDEQTAQEFVESQVTIQMAWGRVVERIREAGKALSRMIKTTGLLKLYKKERKREKRLAYRKSKSQSKNWSKWKKRK